MSLDSLFDWNASTEMPRWAAYCMTISSRATSVSLP